ncbi:hypothetical protein AK830_g12360 [Neonectria ditissima]|uniref:Uncharacterized protein n=1 Tax=Neonectria ditissima TaxID=78410 RepID=A0A0P7B3I8_9HYPO|nr:hypothetical protein AK830_g12360 [Neonectria ditissima]
MLYCVDVSVDTLDDDLLQPSQVEAPPPTHALYKPQNADITSTHQNKRAICPRKSAIEAQTYSTNYPALQTEQHPIPKLPLLTARATTSPASHPAGKKEKTTAKRTATSISTPARSARIACPDVAVARQPRPQETEQRGTARRGKGSSARLSTPPTWHVERRGPATGLHAALQTRRVHVESTKHAAHVAAAAGASNDGQRRRNHITPGSSSHVHPGHRDGLSMDPSAAGTRGRPPPPTFLAKGSSSSSAALPSICISEMRHFDSPRCG